MVFDLRVAQRLGDGGVVDFAVAVAAITDEVDDDVGMELVAVIGGEGGDAHDSCGVFSIDVEDGDGEALGQVGGEARGIGFLGFGSESDEIVNDDVNAAAYGVAVDGAEVHGFRPDSLTGEGRVAVNNDRQDAIDAVNAIAVLTSTGAAHGHWIDSLEMARVRDEVQRDMAAIAGGEFAGRANVVLDVAAAENAARIDVFEAGEDVHRRFAEDVDHDAEAAAVAHAQDGALRVQFGGTVEKLVKKRNEGGDAFEGEALGAEIARLDHMLKDVGASEELKDVVLVRGRGQTFETLRDPIPTFAGGDVHEFGADGRGVDAAGLGDEFVVEVEFGQGQRREVLTEGIEMGLQIAPATEGVEGLFAQLRRRNVGAGIEGNWGHQALFYVGINPGLKVETRGTHRAVSGGARPRWYRRWRG
jgi:hypothetical protein